MLTAIVKSLLAVLLLAFGLLLAWAFESRNMPALASWHTVALENEFTAADADPQITLADYLVREDRLFTELREKVYERDTSNGEKIYNRYQWNGPQDPAGQQRNWNRTFELVPAQIRAGALLLHGLTDSPYSLRRVGEILQAQGYYVLGLRLPGHGTIPGALTTVRWEDWVAASRLGARHVRARIGNDKPFWVGGYSNGGALSVKYALDTLTDPDLPAPDQLLLFSPEIGIAPVAMIANSHKLLSFLPYFEQFKWLSVEPEYDPFKYNSFSKNAAQEAWEVTAAIHHQIKAAHDSGRFTQFPRVLTFLSWTDATVDTSATVQQLYGQLQNAGSELVVFDVNRFDRLAAFIPASRERPLDQLEASADLPYRLTVITNVTADVQQVAQHTQAPRSNRIDSKPLPMAWPDGAYSLTHVAIPFAPNDPVYGADADPPTSYRGLPLGALQPRGETHLLTASLSQLMRLRHNPFFDYVEQRIAQRTDDAPQSSSKDD